MNEEAGPSPARPMQAGRLLRPDRVAGMLIVVLAIALRVLFWQATEDRGWAYSALYKGDAAVWLAYAEALDGGEAFELGLPLRPPGMACLVALLWDGSDAGLPVLRMIWCVLGAGAVLLFYLAVLRSFGLPIAVAALLVVAEGVRCSMQPTVVLDGREISARDPFPVGEHVDRRVEVR